MILGIPKEIKDNENRVAITPSNVMALVEKGHKVLVEKSAGIGSGISDEDYARVGATMIEDASEVWARAEMIVKVKEPLPSEYKLMRPGQVVFTYFHLASEPFA